LDASIEKLSELSKERRSELYTYVAQYNALYDSWQYSSRLPELLRVQAKRVLLLYIFLAPGWRAIFACG
jgi:hypothetical protein